MLTKYCHCRAGNLRTQNDNLAGLLVMDIDTVCMEIARKLEEYKLLDAVKVILLVDTEAPRATVWRRGADGWGNVEIAGLDQVIDLPEIGCALPLAELFEGLTFAPGSIDAEMSSSPSGVV